MDFQQAREQDLLLIAARQKRPLLTFELGTRSRGSDRGFARCLARGRSSRPPRLASSAGGAQVDVVEHALSRNRPLPLRSSVR